MDLKCRLWIYSHHIYNKNKRKLIQDTARSYDLSGFFRSGKPGFICVEGNEDDCDQFWKYIRSLNWQKISLIQKEIPLEKCVFNGFHEMQVENSELFRFLKEKNCSDILKNYLGMK